jgi:hypothetical protein
MRGSARVVELAERGIAACRREDRRAVAAVFLELTASLDFRYDEAARGLADLYRANVAAARRGVFGPALATLTLLRAPEGRRVPR